VALLAILGAGAWVYWPTNSAVATIESAGGSVRKLTAPEYRGGVEVRFESNVTDEQLETMTALDELRPLWLQVQGKQITGRGLAALKRLTTLRGLTLARTSIGDDDLVHLKAFPELSILNLDGNAITSRGLAHLQALPKLSCLSIRITKLKPADVLKFQAEHKDVTVYSEFTDPPDDE
jgi:hypothetical protein